MTSKNVRCPLCQKPRALTSKRALSEELALLIKTSPVKGKGRFATISDLEVKEFTEKLENENTKKKTLYDIKVFKEYLDACDEKREIEDITPVELQEIIKKFVLAVRKKNGEEYEPSSLRAFIQASI